MEYSIETREMEEQLVIVGRRQSPRSGIAAAIAEVLPLVFRYAQGHEIAVVGPPFVRYIDPDPDRMTYEPGMPIATRVDEAVGKEAREAEGLSLGLLPGGLVATTVHIGPYEGLHEAYRAIEQWMTEEGMTPAGKPWESYLTDPSSVPDPSEWRTEVCWPVTSG